MGIFPLFAVAVALLSATPAVAALTAPEKRIIATVEAERAAILMSRLASEPAARH